MNLAGGFIPLATFFYHGQPEGTIHRTKDGEVTLEAAAEGAQAIPDEYTEYTTCNCPSRLMVADTTKLILRRHRIR